MLSMVTKLFRFISGSFHTAANSIMAQSRFEYVRNFECADNLLPNSWIVVRIDGKKFHSFTDKHGYSKPNEKAGLDLMAAAAKTVLQDFKGDIVLAYGQSDEFSFVFKRDTDLYSRRSAKLTSNVVSLFSSAFVFQWREYFPDRELLSAPSFDARAVLYPTNKNLRDYLSWRQADCHINNLYNTVFWALIQKGGLSNRDAENRLRGTLSGDKNEILFSEFDINYNNEPAQYRKGTVIHRKKVEIPLEKEIRGSSSKWRTQTVTEHCDIIGDDFWAQNKHILEPYSDC